VSTHETLGLLLVREGLISRPQLYDALRLQRQSSELLGTCLLRLGYVSAERLLAILARQLAVPALPPGVLGTANPEAVHRVPKELAYRLRIVPFSWDGEMLGVAVADGRTLSQLQEVAYVSRSAVGAYVALELEIGAALAELYPAEQPIPSQTIEMHVTVEDRPRPVRAVTYADVPKPPAPDSTTASVGVLPAVPAAEIERISFFDAVEKLYEAKDSAQVAHLVGQALKNFFPRLLVCEAMRPFLVARAVSGFFLRSQSVPLAALPKTAASLLQRSVTYGPTRDDPRSPELESTFGISHAAMCLIAVVTTSAHGRLLFYADHGSSNDRYDDLHDVEMLFKEAETALEILTTASRVSS